MTDFAHFLPYCGILLMIIGGITDLKARVIPNWISLSLILLFAISWTLSPNSLPLLSHLYWGGTTFIVLLGFYAFDKMGGGDVKLITSVALWCGPVNGFEFLVVTSLVGGALGLIAILPIFRVLWDWFSAVFNLSNSLIVFPNRHSIPYGIAIAIGGGLSLSRAYLG